MGLELSIEADVIELEETFTLIDGSPQSAPCLTGSRRTHSGRHIGAIGATPTRGMPPEDVMPESYMARNWGDSLRIAA